MFTVLPICVTIDYYYYYLLQSNECNDTTGELCDTALRVAVGELDERVRAVGSAGARSLDDGRSACHGSWPWHDPSADRPTAADPS